MPEPAAERPLIDITHVDLGGDLVIITDADGTIVDVNDQFVQVTGYSRADTIGEDPRILKSGFQDPAIYKDLWDTVLSGNVWSGQLVDRHRDGSNRTHRVTLTPLVDHQGVIHHIVAVQRDLMMDLERQTSVPGIGSLHTDLTGNCVYVDREAAVLLNAPAEGLFGAGWHRQLIEDDLPAVQEAMETAVSAGRTLRLDVQTLHLRWLHLRVETLRSGQGRPIGTSWSIEDVTDTIELHARLARRDALVSALLEAHEDAIAVLDEEGLVVAINHAWAHGTTADHPALGAATGDQLDAFLRESGESGDEVAAASARHLATMISGVPAVSSTSGTGLHITPVRSVDGGMVVRLPMGSVIGRDH